MQLAPNCQKSRIRRIHVSQSSEAMRDFTRKSVLLCLPVLTSAAALALLMAGFVSRKPCWLQKIRGGCRGLRLPHSTAVVGYQDLVGSFTVTFRQPERSQWAGTGLTPKADQLTQSTKSGLLTVRIHALVADIQRRLTGQVAWMA
jgi:hypothetical protein